LGQSLPLVNILYITFCQVFSFTRCAVAVPVALVTARSRGTSLPLMPDTYSLPVKTLRSFSVPLSSKGQPQTSAVYEFITASVEIQKPSLGVILRGVFTLCFTGVEYKHMRVCSYPERAQAWHRMPPVQGSTSCQWIFRQYHQVGAHELLSVCNSVLLHMRK